MKKILWAIAILGIVILSIVVVNKNYATKGKWVNWGGNLTCDPKQIHKPKTKQELLDIIQQAITQDKKIRPYGSAHSWSPIVCSEILIDMTGLNKLLSVEKDQQLVTVEGGIKIWDLNEKLKELNLALPNQSFQQGQTIVGNIATATHGTGQTGSFANFIEALELITPEGEIKKITKNDKELFPAAVTSIGALGVIYSVTIKCVPLFKVSHKRTRTNFADMVSNYKELNNKHDFFQFFWNPYSDSVLTYTWDKTDKEVTTFWNYILKIKDKTFTAYTTGAFWKGFLDVFPFLYPKFIDMYQWLAATGEHVAYPDQIMTAAKKSTQEVIYQEEEIAIPMDSLKNAAQDVRALFKKYQKENYYPLFWGVLFRFTKKDENNLLSMNADEDKIYLSITSAHVNKDFYKEFEDAMMKYGGKPHWGKINFVDYDRAKKLYGDNLDKFIEIRKKLDPNNRLINDYIKRVFTKPE